MSFELPKSPVSQNVVFTGMLVGASVGGYLAAQDQIESLNPWKTNWMNTSVKIVSMALLGTVAAYTLPTTGPLVLAGGLVYHTTLLMKS